MAAKALCSIPDCDKPIKSRGLCSGHYKRFNEQGEQFDKSPLSPKSPRLAIERFLASAIAHTGPDCLEWPFALDDTGYARVRWNGKCDAAHRIVCFMTNGEAPRSHQAAHSCGNRGCVSPLHLRWATNAENYADMWGHGTVPIGERHGKSVLTEDIVRKARNLHASGGYSVQELANMFEVQRTTLGMAISRRTWAWLT